MEVIGTDPIAFLFWETIELSKPPAIKVHDLVHEYGDRRAVDNIDLEIESFIESQESIGVAIKKLRKVKNFQEYEVLISQKK